MSSVTPVAVDTSADIEVRVVFVKESIPSRWEADPGYGHTSETDQNRKTFSYLGSVATGPILGQADCAQRGETDARTHREIGATACGNGE